jgi:succinate dehydrogenase / fumarate reductase flavoprotein subunit
MYEKITGVNPFQEPMTIFPAVHYTMGGLWVDYHLMSNLPGLFILGEANFSDHGANRLGASALMQGLADGYFIISYALANYLASNHSDKVDTDHPAFKDVESEVTDRMHRLLSIRGKRTVDDFHRELGLLLWDKCGIERNEKGLKEAGGELSALREAFWRDVMVPGDASQINPSLEKAGRVADFLEFAELMIQDALKRTESCGAHLREESQTEEGEALRDDENFSYVAAWEHCGVGEASILHKEELAFEEVKPAQRSYK